MAPEGVSGTPLGFMWSSALISYLKFGLLLRCRFGSLFGCLLDTFVAPKGVSGTPLGVIWSSSGSLFGVFAGTFGCCGVP